MEQHEGILIIEDDEDIQESIRDLLELEQYSVKTASNGKDALKKLETAPLPSLILLDLFMPIMDGKQFLLDLQRYRPDLLKTIPIIILTAAPMQGEMAQSIKGLVAEFVKKPVSAETLSQIAAKYCKRKCVA